MMTRGRRCGALFSLDPGSSQLILTCTLTSPTRTTSLNPPSSTHDLATHAMPPPPPPPPALRGPRPSLLTLLLRPVHELRSYTTRAVRAASYPVRGVWYFLRHPEFFPLFVGRLLPLSIISFLVYFLLFTFAFLPQYLFLLIFHGAAGALINTTVLVLGEGLVVIQGLFEGFFVDECRVDIFDVSSIIWRASGGLVGR